MRDLIIVQTLNQPLRELLIYFNQEEVDSTISDRRHHRPSSRPAQLLARSTSVRSASNQPAPLSTTSPAPRQQRYPDPLAASSAAIRTLPRSARCLTSLDHSRSLHQHSRSTRPQPLAPPAQPLARCLHLPIRSISRSLPHSRSRPKNPSSSNESLPHSRSRPKLGFPSFTAAADFLRRCCCSLSRLPIAILELRRMLAQPRRPSPFGATQPRRSSSPVSCRRTFIASLPCLPALPPSFL
ncbi:hypothetical protein ACOSQ2_014902 [Xanthoceras sorbifolium]